LRVPKSRRSARPAGIAAQLTATTSPATPEARWNTRAASSLPEPLSPVTRSERPPRAARSTALQVARRVGPTTPSSRVTLALGPSKARTSATAISTVRPIRITVGAGAASSIDAICRPLT
jgi:hypothetical protein